MSMTATPTPLRERCKALVAKWRGPFHGRSGRVDDGARRAYRHCADDLDAALSAPGACPYTTRCDCLGACKHGFAGTGATPPASGEAGADECRERIVGYWNCGCPACRQRVAENTLAPPPAAAGEVYVDFGDAIGTAGPFPVIEGRVALPKATKDDLCSRLAAVAPAGMTVKDRDALWCEAIVNTQKWSTEFRALACDTVELLRYFNASRPDDTPPATAGKE